jgi:hypothetical protein
VNEEHLLGTERNYKLDNKNKPIHLELPDIVTNETEENVINTKILYITKEVFLSLNTNKIEGDEYIKSEIYNLTRC